MTEDISSSSQDFVDPVANGAATANGTIDDIAQKLHDAVDRIALQAHKAERRLNSASGDVGSLFGKTRDAAAAKTNDLSSGLRDYVQEHPVASLGIAFGAGLLVAALLRRNP